MFQIASEITFKYAAALFSEVLGLTHFKFCMKSAAKFPETYNTTALKSVLNNKRLCSAIASFEPKNNSYI